jgi:hypothetical protein
VESAPATLCKEDASSNESMRVKFEQAVRQAQDEICKAVSELDGKEFHEDAWTRPGGGGGVSRVLQVIANCIQQSMHAIQTACHLSLAKPTTHIAARLYILCNCHFFRCHH